MQEETVYSLSEDEQGVEPDTEEPLDEIDFGFSSMTREELAGVTEVEGFTVNQTKLFVKALAKAKLYSKHDKVTLKAICGKLQLKPASLDKKSLINCLKMFCPYD